MNSRGKLIITAFFFNFIGNIIFNLSIINVLVKGYSFEDDAKNWCQYLNSSVEPNVIVYNRLPKCASSTMNSLFTILSRRNDFLKYYSTEAPYWYKDLTNSENAVLLSELQYTINNIINRENTTKHVIVEGHWHQQVFYPHFFGNNISVEYIQLIRDCPSRRRSWFLYFLKDSRAARAVKKIGDQAFEKHQRIYLNIRNSNISIDDCLRDYDCLKKSYQFNHIPELEYLCGSECQSQYKNMLEGSIENTFNPSIFTAVGITDKFGEYLEMLECAYPKIFQGIKRIFVSTNRKKVNQGSSPSNNTSLALRKIIQEACDISHNRYSVFYAHMDKVFNARYKYMVDNKNTCCRKLPL